MTEPPSRIPKQPTGPSPYFPRERQNPSLVTREVVSAAQADKAKRSRRRKEGKARYG